ncbi:death on curing protein [Bryocella elongata]|uniref:Death on curing protein n=1 Tax=Bryocella elongata TaxID=863522 RepID=A0A1H5YHR1_9BACT|nr:type II toxin-antitoxin system death-on-curing family toxin [Bryocella elongata]SEG23588.1 death on curing protein [Bryocella elongata]
MNVVYVRSDVLRNVHDRLIERYGGVAGVRDENAFESAIGRPRNLASYGEVTSIPRLAAALPWAILRNHPFADGNKRTAFAALMIFLDRNGYGISCTEVEETAMVLRAAASEITEDQWTDWVERTAVLLKP